MAEAEPQGVISQVTRLGDRLITSLPPAFLILVLLNCAFLGLVMWFLNAQSAARNQLVSALVQRCMDIALHAPPPQ